MLSHYQEDILPSQHLRYPLGLEGTHCEQGRRAWDTFLSLLLTCRKHRISFAAYLKDRILGLGQIERLSDLIRVRAQGPPLPSH